MDIMRQAAAIVRAKARDMDPPKVHRVYIYDYTEEYTGLASRLFRVPTLKFDVVAILPPEGAHHLAVIAPWLIDTTFISTKPLCALELLDRYRSKDWGWERFLKGDLKS